MSRTILYHAEVPGGVAPRELQALAERMPYGKRVCLPLRREDRAASLLGLALALRAAQALRGRRFSPERLRFETSGRPLLADGPCFSIAHTGAQVVVAACDEGRIGVDAELPAESRLAEDKLREWSAREAAVKALGLGLRAAPRVVLGDGLARLDGRLLYLHPLRIPPAGLGWIASESAVGPATPVHADAELVLHAALAA